MLNGWRGTLIAAMTISVSVATASAQSAQPRQLPAPSFPAPASNPPDPAGWNAFHPPLSTAGISPLAPAIAQCNSSAGPDDTVAVTGDKLQAGATFSIFGQTTSDDAMLLSGEIQVACPAGDLVTLPASLPPNSMYLLWPKSQTGVAGLPVAVNRTQAWWLSAESASPGLTISAYGRDLTNAEANGVSWVYLEPASDPSPKSSPKASQWAAVTAATPYKVDFTIPQNVPTGSYHVWLNNGRGRRLSWSGPIALEIKPPSTFAGNTLTVKDYGATADGKSDDAPAIIKALAALHAGDTLHFPAGTYRVLSRQINLPANVRLLGDGPDRSILRFEADVVSLYKQTGYGPYAIGGQDGWSGHYIGAHDVEVSSIGLQYRGPSTDGALVRQRSGAHLAFKNCSLLAGSLCAIDWLGSSDLTLQNCTFEGRGVSAISVHHMLIDQSRFFLTHEAEEAITVWNGHAIAITHCTVQNTDDTATDPQLCGQGRFLENGQAWGSIYHEYVAGNTTIRIGAPHAGNAGEQLCNEGSQYAYSGRPVGAAAASITIPMPPKPPASWAGWNVIVTAGPGLGQLRTVTTAAPDSNQRLVLSLDLPWNVPPSAQSSVQVCTTIHDCVFTDNTLQCRTGPRGAVNEPSPTGLWAATGLELWSGGWGIVFDANRTENLNDGVLLATDDHGDPLTRNPCYFVDIINNQLTHSRLEGVCLQSINGNPDPEFVGVTIRGNRFDGGASDASPRPSRHGPSMGISLSRTGHPGTATLAVVEHNVIVNDPVGAAVFVDPASLLYSNHFNAGTAAGPGAEAIAAGGPQAQIHLKKNLYQNYPRPTPAADPPAADPSGPAR